MVAFFVQLVLNLGIPTPYIQYSFVFIAFEFNLNYIFKGFIIFQPIIPFSFSLFVSVFPILHTAIILSYLFTFVVTLAKAFFSINRIIHCCLLLLYILKHFFILAIFLFWKNKLCLFCSWSEIKNIRIFFVTAGSLNVWYWGYNYIYLLRNEARKKLRSRENHCQSQILWWFS